MIYRSSFDATALMIAWTLTTQAAGPLPWKLVSLDKSTWCASMNRIERANSLVIRGGSASLSDGISINCGNESLLKLATSASVLLVIVSAIFLMLAQISD